MSEAHFQLTRHARERMAQRGFCTSDIRWIINHGSEVEGGYLLRAKDIPTGSQAVRRLIGAYVVVAGGTIVTAYHTNRQNQRRLLQSLR